MCHHCLPSLLDDEDFHQWKLAVDVLVDWAGALTATEAPMQRYLSIKPLAWRRVEMSQWVRQRWGWHLNWQEPGLVETAIDNRAHWLAETAKLVVTKLED